MVLAIAAVVAGATGQASAADTTIRIGVQKYGTLIILQELGNLEKRLEAQGVTVEWTEFPAGPQLLEGLAVGSIDIGHTGEAPPVFAQAAGAPLVYVGVEPPAPLGEAILVPKESPVQSIADLKDKRIALNKGSNVHYLLVKALAQDGYKPDDVETVFLPPSDARAAFERGSVDAWVIWDPFLAAAQEATQARVLKDGSGLVSNHQFYLASRSFTDEHPDLVQVVLAELDAVDKWAASHQDEIAELLSPRTGISVDALKVALGRLSYGVKPIGEEVIAEQQRIADTFQELGLIPKKIMVREAVWNAPKS
ncbi:MAG: sulfonate ABC transporter substrate-binding protein [Rhodospirillales bacterium]|nr:sulfonate ABC transporter substrate-binding protein [Rhodospirillales bacterium]